MNAYNIYIICIKDLIPNKWRQVIFRLFQNSVIMNLNNIYIICNIYVICIKDLISNKWRQNIIPLFQ